MKKMPWYIWLSLPAFLVLTADTERYIIFHGRNPLKLITSGKELDLWLGFVWQLWVNMGLIIILPEILMGILFKQVGNQVPELTRLLGIIQFLSLYPLGVCAAYRLVLWRRKHFKDKYEEPPEPCEDRTGDKA